MQDSLGGNAKTLMFVNISPADYNQEETVTALTYATRVKLITNTAEKQQVKDRIGWYSVPSLLVHTALADSGYSLISCQAINKEVINKNTKYPVAEAKPIAVD